MKHRSYFEDNFFLNPEWWIVLISFLGVIISSVIAYIAVFGSEKILKPRFDFSLHSLDQTINGKQKQVFRIKVENVGSRKAHDLIASVVEICDKKSGRYFLRKDFIDIPLQWTHFPSEIKTRDLSVGQAGFFDLGEYDFFDPGFILSTNPKVNVKQINEIPYDATMTVRINESKGMVKEIGLKLKHKVGGIDIDFIPE